MDTQLILILEDISRIMKFEAVVGVMEFIIFVLLVMIYIKVRKKDILEQM